MNVLFTGKDFKIVSTYNEVDGLYEIRSVGIDDEYKNMNYEIEWTEVVTEMFNTINILRSWLESIENKGE